MSQQNLDFTELQELKNQFNILNMKLEKQRIINEDIIKESMKEKLSYIEKWYRNRFCTSIIAAPIAGIVFMFIGQYGFGTLILLTGILEFILNRKAYRALDIKNLISMTMTQASENIIKHKQLRSINNKILTLPLIALVIWTILVAGGYTWNPKVIIITVSMIGVSIFWGLYQMKENQKKLENVLKQIKTLRE